MRTSFTRLMIAITMTLATTPIWAESFSGRILDTNGTFPGASSVAFYLQIDDYSTDGEIKDLAATLEEQGSLALEREMNGLDRGWLRIGNEPSQQVAVTRSIDSEDGGRILRVLVSRNIAFFESWHRTRSRDYPYTILELEIDAEGRGKGKMIAAAQFEAGEDSTVEVDSLGWKPLKIVSVRTRES